ncbi:MAG: hypothetical protein L6408_02135 [Nanoarchaeota archaeon]|nr:hypothetical protein [Nanoarchaeota archaeon]
MDGKGKKILNSLGMGIIIGYLTILFALAILPFFYPDIDFMKYVSLTILIIPIVILFTVIGLLSHKSKSSRSDKDYRYLYPFDFGILGFESGAILSLLTIQALTMISVFYQLLITAMFFTGSGILILYIIHISILDHKKRVAAENTGIKKSMKFKRFGER